MKNLKASAETVAFTYGPEALPLPMNAEYTKAEAVVDLTQEFNRELITLSGLAKGDYALSMAGLGGVKATIQQT